MDQKDRIIKIFKAEDEEEIKRYLKQNKLAKLQNEPYLRHLDILFRNGKPPGKYHIIHLKHKGIIYLIGTVVFSRGKRILFFPGFKHIKLLHENSHSFYNLNHITCEKSLKEGHFKYNNRNVKATNFTFETSGEFNFWFGLAVNNPYVFHRQPKAKLLMHSTKNVKNDFNRRVQEARKAYKDAKGFDIKNRDILTKEFLNFEFFIQKGSLFNQEEFLKIRLRSNNAKFRDKQYRGMILAISNSSFNLILIIRLAILIKNEKNRLNDLKSTVFHSD